MAFDSRDLQVSKTPRLSGRQGSMEFYKKRGRIYTGLLLFVVVAGLPILTVPVLRHRLAARVHTLRWAMSGKIEPVTVRVGENTEPFPSEYERPLPVIHTAEPPPVERIFTAGGSSHVPQPAQTPQESSLSPMAVETDMLLDQSETQMTAEESQPAEEVGPQYRQGEIEREAYDFLIASNTTVAGMVEGSNPSLQFSSWGAAKRDGDVYWVRLEFQSAGKVDVEYIWQVELQSRQVTPLSYNARAIPQ